MRKAIALVLLIVLGTMPLQTSAQVSVPSVDLRCLYIFGEVQTNDVTDSNTSSESNSSSEILALINTNESEPSANVSCTVSNPNSYVERIQIQVDASGLVAETNGTITLAPNGEESFNITLLADQNMTPGYRVLNVTATVVEANGAPPPNIAENFIEGIVWIVNDDFINSPNIEITEIGPFKSSVESYNMENGTEYPVLYLKESFHIDAIMTGWDGNPIDSNISYKLLGSSIDELISNFNLPIPDYIKLDVDGLEHLILRGGINTLTKIKSILVEVNTSFLSQSNEVNEILRQSGLRLENSRLSEHEPDNISEENLIPTSTVYNQIWTR